MRDCRRVFHACVRVLGRDTRTGPHHTCAEAERAHARISMIAGGETVASVSIRTKNRLITTSKSTG